jgi:DNA-binding response OmpR family regulator/AraC-like DNA-binding protein
MVDVSIGVVERRQPPRAAPESTRPSSRAEPPRATLLRLLVIDNEPAVLESTRRLMEREGFAVETAGDGESGLALALHRSYDVILLDQVLPGMQGPEVLRRLRLNGVWAPVVVFTGFASATSAFEAAALGATNYLEKPVRSATLVLALRAAAAATEWRSLTGPPLFAPCPASDLRRFDAVRGQLNAWRRSPRARIFGRLSRDKTNALVRQLARSLCLTDVTVFEFVAMADGLSAALEGSRRLSGAVVEKIHARFDEAAKRVTRPINPRLAFVLTRLEGSGPEWAVDEDELAADMKIDRVTLWRLLDRELGLTFSDCRAIVVVRRAIVELAGTKEHVQQIAFHLGFRDASTLNHVFRRVLGTTPGEFRYLLL